jgi:hypothetical protein
MPSISFSLFFPDGSSGGRRLVERSSWTGRGLLCPRSVFAEAKSRANDKQGYDADKPRTRSTSATLKALSNVKRSPRLLRRLRKISFVPSTWGQHRNSSEA